MKDDTPHQDATADIGIPYPERNRLTDMEWHCETIGYSGLR